MPEAKLSVETELDKVIKELTKIRDLQKATGEEAKKTGDAVGESVRKQARESLTMMENLQTFGKKVYSQIKDDMKALAGINALQGALKLNSQFQGAIKESISLSDSIRKLGNTFGIAEDRYSAFKSKLVKGMGDIGASSEAAARVLEGLADSTVRDEESLLRYSKIASQLSSISREPGNEGNVAKGIEKIAVAQGKNAGGAGVAEGIAGDVTKAALATGMKSSDILAKMDSVLQGMDPEKRKTTTTRALAQQAVAGQVAGGQTMDLFTKFQSLSKERRGQFEAFGLDKLFGKGGEMNMQALPQIMKQLKATGLSSKEAALAATGDEGAAEGLVRLMDNADKVSEALGRLDKSSNDFEKTAKNNRTMMEAFNANINKVKGSIGTAFEKYGIGDPMKGITDMLNAGANEESGLGSAGVVAGGGLLAAVLASGGLKTLGGALGGGMGGSLLKGAAAQAITGKEVQPVYVVNASEIGGGGAAGALSGMGGKMGTVAKFAGKAGMVGAAFEASQLAGEHIVNPMLDKYTQGKTSEGFEGNAVERLIFKMDQLFGGESAKGIAAANQMVEVKVSAADPGIRVQSKAKTTRGMTQ